ncbi:MAG: hypothetical protein WKF87_06940 [Chryseolinea sp.]
MKTLPSAVTMDCLRYEVKIISETSTTYTCDFLDGGTPIGLPKARVKVGLHDKKVCVDIPETLAKKHKL